MWLIFKCVFFFIFLFFILVEIKTKTNLVFFRRFRLITPFSKTFWKLTVLVDLPAEVLLAIIGALLDKVVARLGLSLSGDVVMEEGVGAERVFVAVAHVALQAGSCKQTMLSGFSLGCKCEVAVSFLADPSNRKFHIVWLILQDSYIYVFDFWFLWSNWPKTNFRRTFIKKCLWEDSWAISTPRVMGQISGVWRPLTALQNFAMPELFLLPHALVCRGWKI